LENKKWCVYKHTNKINGKCYIGITSQPIHKRWKNGLGYIRSSIFYNAILKYGWNGFEHEILYSNMDELEAKEKEVELIEKYKSFDRDFGYNRTLGGELNIPTEETKKKMSESQKGDKNHFYNKKHTKEALKKISDSSSGKNNPNYGKTLSIETRRKISNSLTGKIIPEETKSKMRNSQKNRTKESRVSQADKISIAIVQLTTELEFIKKWNSSAEAQRNGFNASSIIKCCKNKRKTHCGYIWKYEKTYRNV
jgi:group I intron endonuclease